MSRNFEQALHRIKVVALSAVLFLFVGLSVSEASIILFGVRVSSSFPLCISGLSLLLLLVPIRALNSPLFLRLFVGIPQVVVPLLLLRLCRFDYFRRRTHNFRLR